MAQFFRGGFSQMPPVTKNLIIINALIWLVEVIFPAFGANGILRHLGLHFVGASDFNPVQFITYMFVHDQHTFFHVLFNMFTLFFFGPLLERVWGSKRFFLFYMVCGIGAGIVQEAVYAYEWHNIYPAFEADLLRANAAQWHVGMEQAREIFDNLKNSGDASYVAAIENAKNMFPPVIGASGAIFGILLGFAFVFPNMPMYMFFIPVPIKAKWMVAGYAVIEFFCGVTGAMGTVAHFAHLGGMIFGLAMILWWKHKGTLTGNRFGW